MFEPADPDWDARVRESFARQQLMVTIGAKLVDVAPGEITIELPFRADLTQQHGFLHGGIVTAILDSACGYSALSLMPPEASVLTVEFKVNLLAPARGDRIVARGRVSKPGRVITVCLADAFAVDGGREKPIATMLATMMSIQNRPDVQQGI